jgi:hypothetical protein
VHEPVNAAELPENGRAGAEQQVVGVGQQDLGAVAWVPTGMKTGVRTSPWRVWKRAARAWEPGASFSTVKESLDMRMRWSAITWGLIGPMARRRAQLAATFSPAVVC